VYCLQTGYGLFVHNDENKIKIKWINTNILVIFPEIANKRTHGSFQGLKTA